MIKKKKAAKGMVSWQALCFFYACEFIIGLISAIVLK